VPRAGLNPRTVVEEAARVTDEVRLDRLTFALVALRLGVALPSLYKQVRGLDALLQKLPALATAEIAAELSVVPARRVANPANVHGQRTSARRRLFHQDALLLPRAWFCRG
jgi:hypothetical protein